jgi:hypothetical protein
MNIPPNESGQIVSWRAERNDVVGDWSIYQFTTTEADGTTNIDVVANNLPQKRAILMAAAPELLHACEKAREYLEKGNDLISFQDLLSILNSAIQAATQASE